MGRWYFSGAYELKFRVAGNSVLFAFIFWAAIAAAAQVKPSGPDVPKPGAESAPGANPGKGSDSVGAAVDPNKYVLGVEDVIFVKTWREPDFTLTVAVRPDGKITLPLINEVQAAGLTPQQLTLDLKEKLGKFVNNPDVTIFVTDVRSKKYYIDGEVNRPGSFPLITPTKVLEALSNAAGFKEFANKKKIKILRGDKSFRFNYVEVSKGKHLEQNIYLDNGDHIIVQ
jgi:polysaccharide export outer membrane protein